MANRILIFDASGAPLIAMDGHHGSRHAAEWTAQVLAQLAAQGTDAIAVEVIPQQGGDAMRHEVIGDLANIRAEFHTLPDGRRELFALHARAQPDPGQPAARAMKAATAAVPRPILGCVRVLQAPADVANPRCAIRVGHGRDNVPAGQPRTIDELRAARRAKRAAGRIHATEGKTA